MKPTADWDMAWHETLQGSMGSAHSVSGEPPPRDRVQELRAVVEEITRKPLPERTRRIGFV